MSLTTVHVLIMFVCVCVCVCVCELHFNVFQECFFPLSHESHDCSCTEYVHMMLSIVQANKHFALHQAVS